MQYSFYDILGNIGVTFIILSYLFLQLGKIDNVSFKFSFYNATGALLIIISLIQQFNLSAFIIEAFWLLISIWGMVRFFKNKQKI